MKSAKEEIQEKLGKIVYEIAGGAVEVKLDAPQDLTHGDYSSSVSLQLSKNLGKNPREIAEEIKIEYEKIGDSSVEKVEIAGPGFINFFLSKDYLLENLSEVLDKKEAYGTSEVDKGKKVVVEFSSPNIAKPFTVGHLRSTIIGNAVSNLLAATGYTVLKDNHLGDWGTQFGKQIFALRHINLKTGTVVETVNESVLKENIALIESSEHPVKLLVDLYVKFHELAEKNPGYEDVAREYFRQLELGDEESRMLWQKCIDWSFKEFDRLYKMLDVSFTENGGRGYGESFFEDKMQPIIEELKEKKVAVEDDGALIVRFPEDKFPPLMIVKKDGGTLYSTRDLATDKFRIETYGKDIVIINEVGAEQSLYFQQLYELEVMLGWFSSNQRIHLRHGLYRFKDQKMSTRKGNTIWLEDVLQEAIDKAAKLTESREKSRKDSQLDNSLSIGIGALKWNDLKRTPVQDIVFDWNDILNMEGNSGPYIQYAYARTQNILQKAENNHDFNSRDLKLETEERVLLKMLSYYPEILEQASQKLSTSMLCTYLFELAQAFSTFYEKHRIIGIEDKNVMNFRLELTAGVGQVLKNGLTLLGIKAPEKI